MKKNNAVIVGGALAVACAVVVAIGMSGCTLGNPYLFSMGAQSGWPIEGRIGGDYHLVQREAPNVLTVSSGASIAMRVATLTDGMFSTEATLNKGTHMTLMVRTTPNDWAMRPDNGIALVITPTQATLTMESGASVTVEASCDVGKPSVIEIVNEGSFVDVNVACSHVGRMRTSLPSTEWIIVEPSNDGEVTIIDPRIRPLEEARFRPLRNRR